MTDLDELTKSILAFRDARNWKQFHNPKDMALSLTLEAAELLEVFQWCAPDKLDELVRTKRREIGDELADVLYWVLLMAHDLGVNLPSVFHDKMKRNEEKYPAEKFRDSNRKYDEAE